jgi:hypothetical protein
MSASTGPALRMLALRMLTLRILSWRVLACAGAMGVTLALPSAADAQAIRGVILEGNGAEPITGATIDVLRTDSTFVTTVTSDQRGWFRLELDSEGTYLLRPAHPAYIASGLDSVTVGRHEVVSVVLRMGPAVIPLDRLVVAARSRDRLAGFYERAESGGQGRFIHRPFIEARVASLPSELLRMTPGVIITPSEDRHYNFITLRGPGGRCPAAVFLDGLPVPQQIGASIDEFTAADLLEGVEIYDAYTIPPPGLPITINECGIVAFWSRRDAHRPFTWKRLAAALLVGALIVLTAR